MFHHRDRLGATVTGTMGDLPNEADALVTEERDEIDRCSRETRLGVHIYNS